MYKGGPIGWISLESIARQENVDFGWEVIVIEDEGDSERMGEEAIREFEGRMKANGCTGIQYEIMDGRPPLSQKWKRMGELMSESSEIFLLQGCDDYCDPLRFSRTVRLFSDPDRDWIQSRYGLFYDIATAFTVLYDDQLKEQYEAPVDGYVKHPTGLNMAGKSKYFRSLPNDVVKRGVDQWVYRNVVAQKDEPLNVLWDEEEEDWRPAVFTQGLNSISLMRWHLMRKVQNPFTDATEPISEVLPQPLRDRLDGLQRVASEDLIKQLASQLDERDAKLDDFRQMKARRDEKIEKLTLKVEKLKQDLTELSAKRPRGLKRLFSKR